MSGTRPSHRRRAASARSWTASASARGFAQARRGLALPLAPGACRARPCGRTPGSRRRRGPRGTAGRSRGAPPRRGTGPRPSLARPRRAPRPRRASRRRRRPPAPDRAAPGSRSPRSTSAARPLPRPTAAPASDRLDRAQVPLLALDGRHHPPRPLVVDLAQARRRRRSRASVASFERLLAGAARLLERALRLHQVLEAQDRGERVVELRGPFVEQRAQLVVGEEGAVRAERGRPAERVEVGLRLAVELRGGRRRLEGRLGLPAPRHHARPVLALDEERRAERRRGVVEVAPALAPDGGALLPAQAVASEQHLEGLGEARLARAVAPDDERQAGTRPKLERLPRADAAEALDVDRAQECARERRSAARRVRASRAAAPARQLRLERLPALEGREDEAAPRGVDGAVGLEPRQHEAADAGIHWGRSLQ